MKKKKIKKCSNRFFLKMTMLEKKGFAILAEKLYKYQELKFLVDHMTVDSKKLLLLSLPDRNFIVRKKEFGTELHKTAFEFLKGEIKTFDEFYKRFSKENSSISEYEATIILHNLEILKKELDGKEVEFEKTMKIECYENGKVVDSFTGRCDILVNKSLIIEIKTGEITPISIVQSALYRLASYTECSRDGNYLYENFVLINPLSGQCFTYNFSEIETTLKDTINKYLEK